MNSRTETQIRKQIKKALEDYESAKRGALGFDVWCDVREILGAQKKTLWRYIVSKASERDPDVWDKALRESMVWK